MKQDHINYLVVGIFTLSMLAALLVVLYRLTGREADAETYITYYRNITGLDIGSTVTYGGYQVGQVDGIHPEQTNGKTRYKLELAIKSGWKIPDNSVARIVSPGMLADNLIDIKEGNSTKYLAPGQEIKGQEEASIMSVLNSVAYEIKDISDNSIKPLMDNLNRHVGDIGSELGKKLPEITKNVDRLLGLLGDSAGQLKEMLGDENKTHVNNIVKNADEFSSRLLTLSHDFNDTRDMIEDLLKKSSDTVVENRKDLRDSVTALRTSLLTISQNINTIIYNLETTSRNMNEFSRQVRENPGLLLGGSPQQDKAQTR
jgi:phospholipid/cholesterol/gamma-HCH transport system substrate-binding protein